MICPFVSLFLFLNMYKPNLIRMILHHPAGNIPAHPQDDDIARSRPVKQDSEKQEQDIAGEPTDERWNVAQQNARHHET